MSFFHVVVFVFIRMCIASLPSVCMDANRLSQLIVPWCFQQLLQTPALTAGSRRVSQDFRGVSLGHELQREEAAVGLGGSGRSVWNQRRAGVSVVRLQFEELKRLSSHSCLRLKCFIPLDSIQQCI